MQQKETHPVRIIRHELAHNRSSFFQVLPAAIINEVCNHAAGDTANYDRLISINIIGESGSGMTSLVDRFCNEKYEEDPKKIQNADKFKEGTLKHIVLQDEVIKVRLVDNAWHYREGLSRGFRGAHASILLCDATDPEVFNKASKLLSSYVQYGLERVGRVVVVLTKADLIDEAFKTSLAVQQFEENTGIRVRFVSSLTGDNVNNTFESLIASVCAAQEAAKKQADKKNEKVDSLPSPKQPEKSSCCIS